MDLEQAIFASADRALVKGYQIVAHSPGVDKSIAKELHRWSPSNVPFADPNQWALSCYPVKDFGHAVARTVLGGPEYSGRGGLQVVTRALLLEDSQFAKYDYDATLVCRTALALGNLTLPVPIPEHELPRVKLPNKPFFSRDDHSWEGSGDPMAFSERSASLGIPESMPGPSVIHEEIDHLSRIVRQGGRFAAIGTAHPLAVADALLRRLPKELRRQFSFTTGLPLATNRPFQGHFLTDSDRVIERTLASEGIESIRFPSLTGV